MTMSSIPQSPPLPAPAPSWLHGQRILTWGGFTLALALAPWLFNSNASVSFLSQMATLIVFCLSYNMLMGQTGLLSFGHSLYSGMGGFFAIHAMNWFATDGFKLPLPLVPLVGGAAGLVLGIVFGYVMTRKAGIAFAMITLGLSELTHTFAQMFSGFFGGEGGVNANRAYSEILPGINFGPPIQTYYLIAGWTLVCTVAMFAITHTPLGRMANAVRDNPERAEFVGFDTQVVRYLMVLVSTFFAGIAGALAAINYEIISTESLGLAQSGEAVLFTFIGGAGSFVGPIVGAVVGALLSVKLSDYSAAWLMYLGVFFIGIVLFAPGGITGIASAAARTVRSGHLALLAPAWSRLALACTTALFGLVIVVELGYALKFGAKSAQVKALLSTMSAPGLWALGATGIVLLMTGCWGAYRAHLAQQRVMAEIQSKTQGLEAHS